MPHKSIVAMLFTVMTVAPAHAFRFEQVTTLVVQSDYLRYDATVQPLAQGGFVAAWAGTYLGTDVQAQVFRDDGTPTSDRIGCTEDSGWLYSSHPALAATADGGFVLGCHLFNNHILPFATFRHYSADLQPTGERVTVDQNVESNFDNLAPADDHSFVATVEECYSDCLRQHRRYGFAGNELGTLEFPRFGTTSLTAMRENRLLVLGIGKPGSTWGRVAMKVVSGSGRRTGDAVTIFRRRDRAIWQAARVVAGMNERVAILMPTVSAIGTDYSVVLFDSDDNVTVVKPSFSIPNGTDAWVLPLQSGFALVWSYHNWLLRTSIQRYNDSGEAVGEATFIAGDSLLGAPVLAGDGHSYLVPIQRGGSTVSTVEIWRLSSDRGCGDANGDDALTDLDARAILASTMPGGSVCDPCICDVDRSGKVDIEDALAVERAASEHSALTCPVCAAD